MKQVIYTDDQRVPIKLWLDNIEEGALEQAKNLSRLPFVYKHIAIMPDCLSEDTEILTIKGFKLIKNLNKEDLIANYNPKSNKSFFSKPNNIIVRDLRKDEKMIKFTNSNLDKSIVVTENHRMPYIKNMGIKAKNLSQKTEIKDYVWGSYGIENNFEYDIKDELLCLITWIVGDGSIKKNKRKDGIYISHTIRFGLTKERKINRIVQLLNAVGFEYYFYKRKKQTEISLSTNISKDIIEKYIGFDKEYPIEFISKLSTRQAFLLLEEAIKVDGDWINYLKYNTVRYNSKRKSDIDFLSALISLHQGMAKDNTRDTEGFSKIINMHYLNVIKNSNFIESNNGFHKTVIFKEEIQDYKDKVVCVTCDTGFFIARQNGMTFISGNSHQGYGMPIGGVIATEDIIIPNAVGVDISCGMAYLPLGIRHDELNESIIKEIMSEVRKAIPVGFNKHAKEQDPEYKYIVFPYDSKICEQEHENAQKSLGTLGGGNHFWELQVNKDGFVNLMIHSGSRNLGKKVAEYYNKLAIMLNEKWCSSVPKEYQLAFLPWYSDEGLNYFQEMEYCMKFAKANRRLMIERSQDIIFDICHKYNIEGEYHNILDVHHNYARLENHYGKNVMVHRKGATSARGGEYGVIPGSQGTKSYIVKGLGNAESFTSCSHGAGRILGRKAATRELNLEEEIKKLNDQGIIHGIRTVDDLDEASGAYKNIDEVMENQRDLVEIVEELRPIAVIKG